MLEGFDMLDKWRIGYREFCGGRVLLRGVERGKLGWYTLTPI